MLKTLLSIFLLTSTAYLFSAGEKKLDIHFLEEQVKIDGKLDETFYKDLIPAGNFYQYHPQNGAKPTFKTLVYSFFDRKNLYFSFKCFDDDPAKITGDITPFGEYSSNDEVKVYIDTYLDKLTYKTFAVNPRGILKGEQTVWNASARVTDDGWSAEFKIPFKSLRFPVRDIQHWTVNFERFIFRLNETDYWTNVKREKITVFGDTFGKLEGIKNIKGGKNIEVYPYAGYRSSSSDDESDDKFAYGVDLKYGITSNLTMDFTSSPDYSDVESDPFFYQVEPYEVNLQENRPFYYEASGYFSTTFNLFYSRRITDPELAVKVTGKEKGFSLGTLFAKNNKDGNDAYHGVFRLKKDIFKLSYIGVMYSSIEEKGNWNRNVGADFKLTIKDIYTLTGMAAYSYNKNLPRSKNGMYDLRFQRWADEGLNLFVWYHRIEPNVHVPAGYITNLDFTRYQVDGYYSFRWEGKWIEKLVFKARYIYDQAIESDLKTLDAVYFNAQFLTRTRFYAAFAYQRGMIRAQVFNQANELAWEDTSYTHDRYYFALEYKGSSRLQFGLQGVCWNAFVYNNDFTATTNGNRCDITGWTNFKISPQLQLNISYNKAYYKSDDGTIRFDGDLISSRLNYQISKRLSTFIKFQYDSYRERFQYDFLIGYEPANVSKIYFSIKNYSENHFRLFDLDVRSLAFKISYLFRL
jgi:hypothetical protein